MIINQGILWIRSSLIMLITEAINKIKIAAEQGVSLNLHREMHEFLGSLSETPQLILAVYITGLRAPLSLIYVTLVEHSCVLLLTFSLSFYYFTNLELRTIRLM